MSKLYFELSLLSKFVFVLKENLCELSEYSFFQKLKQHVLCMYVSMYVSMYACVYVCVCVQVCVYVCINL